MTEEELRRAEQALRNAANQARDESLAPEQRERARAAATQIATDLRSYRDMQTQADQTRDEPSATRGFMANVQQGATFGFGDEMGAAAQSALGVNPETGGGLFSYDGTLSDRYSANLEQNRGVIEGYREDRPGAAFAAQVAGGMAGGAGVAGAARVAAPRLIPRAAPTAVGRAGQMAAGGALGGAVEGFGAGEGFGDRLLGAGMGAVGGALFAPVIGAGLSKLAQIGGRIGGRALGAFFQNTGNINPQTGELTARGQRRLIELGYDPRQLSAEMQRQFGAAADRLEASADDVTGDAVARLAAADEFNVPLTRGQATGDVPQSATEEAMRSGTRGQGAYNTVTGFDRAQGAAVEAARDRVATGLGNSSGRIDAAEEVISGVRREAEGARQAGRDAYRALEQAGAAVQAADVGALARQIDLAVRNEGFAIDGGTPNAQAAVNMLANTIGRAEGGAIPFQNLERTRQRIIALNRAASRGDRGADQAASAAVLREFDDWMDDTVTNALISGDQRVLDQAREARALWSRYRNTFLGREGADNFVRRIVEDDLAPDQVAGWLFGASQNIGGGQSSLVARRVRDILGEDSAEWGAVRRAGFDYITTPQGRRAPGPAQIAGNIEELLSGKGQTLGQVLYSENERATMRRFAGMLRSIVPPGRATNPSGSGYQVERATQALLDGMAGLLGTSAGGPGTGIAAAAANSTGRDFANAMRARAATQGIQVRPPSVPVAIGGGVAASGAAQEQTVR